MRASRLLSLLLLLQARGRMTARELSDELEVSLRTIYRDVESLSAAGVPVYADRGPTGGYQLLDGYRTRLTGMTGDEADTLFLAGMPGPAAELGLGAMLAAAELKLLAALPPELGGRAARVRQRFHLDAPGWFRQDEPTPHLAALADAVWNDRLVEVRYRRWKQPREVTRTLAPLGVVLKAGRWYLVARAGEETRTYRVGEVLEVTTLDGRFARPDDFDLAGFWQVWTRRYEESVYGTRPRCGSPPTPSSGCRSSFRPRWPGPPGPPRGHRTRPDGCTPSYRSNPSSTATPSCSSSAPTSRCSLRPRCGSASPRRRAPCR